MYCCNDCGEKFEEPNEGLCPKCGSGDIFEEEVSEEATEAEEATENTMEEVVAEADEKNKKGFAASLRNYGEEYIDYSRRMELAKECTKSLFERAKREGITKGMIIAYAQAVQLEEFNAKVLCSAVQQELGMEEISEEEPETNENEAENTTEEISTEEVNDVQQEEQSDSQGDE